MADNNTLLAKVLGLKDKYESLQNQHHLVAFLYAPAAEHVSRAVG